MEQTLGRKELGHFVYHKELNIRHIFLWETRERVVLVKSYVLQITQIGSVDRLASSDN